MSLGLHSCQHVALAQEGTLWLGPAAPALKGGCVPGTTAHPCEDEALVLLVRCIKQSAAGSCVDDLVSGLVWLIWVYHQLVEYKQDCTSPNPTAPPCALSRAPVGLQLLVLASRTQRTRITHCVVLFPTSMWKIQLPLGSPSHTILAVQLGTPSSLCGGLVQWERTRSRWRYANQETTLHKITSGQGGCTRLGCTGLA